MKQPKLNKFTVYKTKSAMVVDYWLDNGKIMLKLANALPGKSGQPELGQEVYSWDAAISISFSYQDLLKCAFKLKSIAYGDDSAKYDKFADLSKVAGKDMHGNKKLSIYATSYKNKKGEDVNIASVNLSLDKENISISLDFDECYALAKHFEMVYQYCLNYSLDKSLEFEKKED